MNILILSRNISLYSTHRLVSECHKKGHKATVLDPLNFNLIIDGNQSKITDQSNNPIQPDVVIPRIGSNITNFGAAVLRHFELKKIPVTLSSDALLYARDKLVALQLLANQGIPVPKTCLLSPLGVNQKLIAQEFEFPAILKLLDSTQGLGVILSETKNNAVAVAEAFQASQQKYIMQKYIAESSGQDIRAFVIGGEVVATMLRKAQEGEFRSNIHRGASARMIQLSEEENEIALQAARILKLNVAGVDIIRSKDGPLVLEVNASPGLEGIEKTTRINIAGRIIEFAGTLARQSEHNG